MIKINYLIDIIISKSQELYSPEEFLAIDESMIKFHGEHSMKIFVVNKPIRRFYFLYFYIFVVGFRAFALCESTSGYVLNWALDRSA